MSGSESDQTGSNKLNTSENMLLSANFSSSNSRSPKRLTSLVALYRLVSTGGSHVIHNMIPHITHNMIHNMKFIYIVHQANNSCSEHNAISVEKHLFRFGEAL